MKNLTIIGVTPFEKPDASLMLKLHQAGAFPVLNLGHESPAAQEALNQLDQTDIPSYGVCFPNDKLIPLQIPEKVRFAILPSGVSINAVLNLPIIYQITSLEEARQAEQLGAEGIIIKGNEAGGLVGYESTFVLFQRVIKEIHTIPVWVQGGIGLHTAAAVKALGAAGVILDSQLALFPESSVPQDIKALCSKLNGTETKIIADHRVLVRPNSPALPENADAEDLIQHFTDLDPARSYIPMGQDISLAVDLYEDFKSLKKMIFGFKEAMYGHLKQAKALQVIDQDNILAKDLGLRYPIAQGPMTRVSDVPLFANAVAEAGALPFVALSLLKGEQAKALVMETKKLAGEKTWGIGILGFAPQALREEQTSYILEAKPPVVLIAGGRPAQAKVFEKAGITTFLYVPSPALLDIFLKEGAKNFIFEGRECGGHVGPLSSMVLWEKQIERILKEDHPENISVFFAGGIHNAFSTAFVSIMAAPLAARGVKVGVLMGTAYLYTQEAVLTGAIQEEFQVQAMQAKDTVLLETAPGHETRCLNTVFARHFTTEKTKLLADGMDKKQVWEELEKLNVGRLRIAAKGVDRKGDKLVSIPKSEQLELGMYMIGQIATMHDRVISLETLHEDVGIDNYKYIQQAALPEEPVSTEKPLDVAIVGMECIFPGAKNLEEYWRNIILGKDSVTEVPDERWNKDVYYHPDSEGPDVSHSKWGGFIPKIDFDPLEFGIPPQSLAAIEPTQLLTLLVAKRAMENAGYGEKNINRENISVIIGAEGGNDLANSYSFRGFYKQVFGELHEEVKETFPYTTEDSFPGILANVIAGRITNRLDLGGRNFTVDAACASSLAALELACQELILGKSDMVLAGGADLHNGINDYLMFSSTHALSRKGRCATFDSDADGIALGEGVAILVLKRYEDAVRDGDRIYSVIKGVGGSSDGKALGLTAPRKVGQVRALERAYAQAGISPASVGLVEAHGTGTVVGDKTELSALTNLFSRSGALPGQTHLGSVKTQIGHTKCAAGLAGLIKASLAVYHGVKPPTLHLQQPNAYYNAQTSPFAFYAESGLWGEKNRYAGISAFGFGGTNFHTVIANHPKKDSSATLQSWPSELFVFRGDTYEEAKNQMNQVKSLLEINDGISLKDIAYSLTIGSEKPIQLSIVADTAEHLMMNIELALSGIENKDTFIVNKQTGKLAFLFPGQGSQRINMARDLFVVFPAMRRLIEGYPELEKIVFPSAVFDADALKKQKETIKDTRLAQPILGIIDLALAKFLESLGIIPDMLAGHSYGELPALCFAGVFEEEKLVDLSMQRAYAILDSVEGGDAGAMAAVSAAEEDLQPILEQAEGCYPVNYNAPSQCVAAGSTAAINKLMEILKQKGISAKKLEVACAFHSPLVAKSKGLYDTVLKDVPFQKMRIPVWSNTTAAQYPAEASEIKERLTDHLVQPVRFVEQIQAMYADGARIFIEVGPGKILTGLTKSCLEKDQLTLYVEDSGRNKISHLLCMLAQYLGTGRNFSIDKLFEGRNAKFIHIDQPDLYKKNPAIWRVNGQAAHPITGTLPANGALPILTPIRMKNLTNSQIPVAEENQLPAERMLQEYLNSMKLLIQAQRDVMLSFLGQNPQINPAPVYVSSVPAHSNGHSSMISVPQSNGVEKPAAIQIKQVPSKDIKSLLLQIVSDKTGYPHEMLGMEMDLEADLSIDSIKRVEIIGTLRSELGAFAVDHANEDLVMEKLASIKTLNGLVVWLTEYTGITAVSEKNGTAEIITSKPTSQTAFSLEELQKAILDIVSEKTGYPKEMLGLDLDLEADLSIDSIKRMEIIGDLKTKIGFGGDMDQADDLMEKLAAIKTLNGLASWINEINNNDIPDTTEPLQTPLSRLRFDLTPAAISLIQNTEILEGKRFAVTQNDNKQSLDIKNELEKYGAIAELVDTEADLTDFDGLIILDLFSSSVKHDIIDHVGLIKKLDLDKAKWVYLISDIPAHLQELTDARVLRHYQGYSGLFKSLAREFEQITCRMISLGTSQEIDHIAEIALKEIFTTDKAVEVTYKQNQRYKADIIPSPLSTSLEEAHIKLEEQSVVLVLGGAQGITSELSKHMSEAYPCTYILVGRSADPRDETADLKELEAMKTKEEIRAYLIKTGKFTSPSEIEKETIRIYKNNQILRTIRDMEQLGSTVVYESLDLCDENGLNNLLNNIYEKYDRLDGVIHGAGLLEDKLFKQKTTSSFGRVFDTKVKPLRVLAEQLRPDCQFVVLFSSIASVYGNKGQTDYAAANSVLDDYANALNKKLKGKVISINWGPWKGAGMVSPTLETEYERRGISLIPLDQGKEMFLNEIKYGTESQVLIMSGNNW
ncbi:acyl transferase domain-containing protein/NAD(P)H-dependent flavin oxidoreductase YrpB (nitropropane dioxygenase family)/NAD(P)-dependent dehydrogenase (short-subunit alcohol dehydrogenase family)/acyl carrier protein [Chryseobacterium sp. H1D6B]|uniref:type I polyketide synthase n=1 Tax=Chryseobacterium sp. H1D6B TaxID=2940588 RepID=UPI0015CB7BDA|nr:type I polyketide synthase [Chryseobacterium sp. H1D6B]MDH6250335.1 acyl transferase domain-containing protein/NAD(P)H-dependent flavin oxidoreductase YrpB (nitropropane dioxygenase family)/NAD(P)-dependent dehydrogenase (short-subunit alcohol dehydrogenase family)/acyl carrier protein [Chryseobacterium sp. H1D6B]